MRLLHRLRLRWSLRLACLPKKSGKAELGDIRKGLALGADGYITKPYSKNQLAEVIRRVLKQPAPQ